MIKTLIALATAVMLAGCVTAASKFEKDFPIGQVVTGKLSVPQGDILLPSGKWTVIGNSITRNNHYQAFGHTALARIDGKYNLNGMVFLMTALETPMGFSFYSSDQCKQDPRNIYFEKITDQHLGTQLCFFVDNWSTWPTGDYDGVLAQAESYLRAHAIDRPDSLLYSVHRIVRRNKFLIAEYGFDFREPVDIAIPDYTPADSSVKKEIYANPRWQKNLDNVIAWSREYHPKIAAEFLD